MTDYVLSADGYAVVRETPEATIAATSLNVSLLNGGFTVTFGTDGTLSVTNYAAQFSGGSGGATISALETVAGLVAGQSLNWVQVISTNDPLGGATSPYLDNAFKPSLPFYSYTAENRDPTLPSNQLNFYDFSTRTPSDLTVTNPIIWTASLYPVIVSGNTLIIENGITWGWTMKPAMVGTENGVFINPQGGTNNIGVGTGTFSWGIPMPDQSSINFTPVTTFNTKPNTSFVLGTLTFHNGTIAASSGADAITFKDSLMFTNVPEKNFDLTTIFTLINTPNVTGNAHLDADSVSIGSFGFTFTVDEGANASVEILAELSTGLSVTPSGTESGAALLSTPHAADPTADYSLAIVGLEDPSSGGYVTSQNNAPALVPDMSRLMESPNSRTHPEATTLMPWGGRCRFTDSISTTRIWQARA